MKNRTASPVILCVLCALLAWTVIPAPAAEPPPLNFVFILTDDQRYDALGCAGTDIRTPHLDALAARGVRFENAFVVLSICSPSRAACLTGRYNSANGVTRLDLPLRDGERTFAHLLKARGYRTAAMGKWHLRSTPAQCGFDEAVTFHGNASWYGRRVKEGGKTRVVKEFIEDHVADRSAAFVEACAKAGKPFVLFHNTQVPHMTGKFTWTPRQETLAAYRDVEIPLPPTWNDALEGKPPYLRSDRHRRQAERYGYDKPEAIREHVRLYRAAITDMDAALGRLLGRIRDLGLEESTWVLFMGDNGWFLGEHGFTSKVLAYEESMRVPMIVAGPGVKPGVRGELVLNIDLAPTMLQLAGVARPDVVHGRSLLPLLRGGAAADWRDAFVYEAPEAVLGSRPLWSVRTRRWKYIRTVVGPATGDVFEELYDLEADPRETANVAAREAHAGVLRDLRARLARWTAASPERGPMK
jgi:arylsulfatase A-like enzyme